MGNHEAISFWKFIAEYEIEIPIIQRDYAQGRKEKSELRKKFLDNIKMALEKENGKLNLDFVYGSIENNRLVPLDGQQRLTTLWLLHWYIALRSGNLTDDNCKILKHFTYKTRVSSRMFCERMCNPENFEHFKGDNIVKYITDQIWFYSGWMHDPTIQSMLRMLGSDEYGNSIEAIFNCGYSKCSAVVPKTKDCYYTGIWKKLTAPNNPVITFYHLELLNFGLSDDMYVKMNARGKQLSDFENLKADIEGYLRKQEGEEWKNLLDPKAGIPIKFDTTWTSIFWDNKSKDNRIDEIYFAFINRFFFNKLLVAKNDNKYILNLEKESENRTYNYLNDTRNPNDYDLKVSYTSLDNYKYCPVNNGFEIPRDLFEDLGKVLDNYSGFCEKIENIEVRKKLFNCGWDKIDFIPEYDEKNEFVINNSGAKVRKISTLNQIQRVVFFAICKYFQEDEYEEESLKRWMRVVWNLVSGIDSDDKPQIRSAQAMRTAAEFINSLNSHDVYQSLIEKGEEKGEASYFTSLDYNFEGRCKEEILKAKQILADDQQNLRKYDENDTWDTIIKEAENELFFHGSIRFLFQGDNGVDWENFDTKHEQVKKLFNEKGINDKYKISLIKNLVCRCLWDELQDKQLFNPNASTWLWLLCDPGMRQYISEILSADELSADELTLKLEIPKDGDGKHIMPLLKNLPYGEIIKEIPKGRFRRYVIIALYPPYRDRAITFDDDQFHRNQILTELLNQKAISVDKGIIIKEGYLWGWNINFEYKGSTYQWHKNNHVYLLKKNKNDYDYCIRDGSKTDETERYFCFKVPDDISSESFIVELKKLKTAFDKITYDK